jgi:hypothetical protein
VFKIRVLIFHCVLMIPSLLMIVLYFFSSSCIRAVSALGYYGQQYTSDQACTSYVIKWEAIVTGSVLLGAKSGGRPVPGRFFY